MLGDWKHVILLSADALRADHLSCYGYNRETSPVLDRLAEQSTRFTDAYSVSSHTREAIPSLLTGKYPVDAIDSRYRLTTESIGDILSDAGFTTGAFHSNPYVSRAYGFDQGFETFDDDLYLGGNRWVALAQRAIDKLRDRHYARAEEINNRALTWLDSLNDEKPFFIWCHYMDTHGPYEPPTNFDPSFFEAPVERNNKSQLYRRAIDEPGTLTEQDHQTLVNNYDTEIAYLDREIGELLDELRDRELLADSLLIFTADHGDAFSEHGYYAHPRRLDDELLHIPLLVHTSESKRQIVNAPTSTLDIVATVRDATGSNHESAGHSLFRAPDSERAVFQHVRGEGGESHLRRFAMRTANGVCECTYNEVSGELKFETSSGNEHQLRSHVDHYLSNQSADAKEREDVGPEVERRLSELGYK